MLHLKIKSSKLKPGIYYLDAGATDGIGC